jgi:hypothetical protein
MTLIVVLNVVLAIAVVGSVVGLLSRAVITSRREHPARAARALRLAARPQRVSRPRSARLGSAEPYAG